MILMWFYLGTELQNNVLITVILIGCRLFYRDEETNWVPVVSILVDNGNKKRLDESPGNTWRLDDNTHGFKDETPF